MDSRVKLLEESMSHLRSTLGRLETALSQIDECIAWTNFQGEVEWCNGSFNRLVGLPQISILGKKIYDILPITSLKENETNEVSNPYEEILSRQKDFHGYFRETNSSIELEINVKFLSFKNTYPVALITARDLSNAREIKQIRLQRQALMAAADSIVITDVEGKVQWANSSFTQLTGYTLEEALKNDLSILKSEKTPKETIKDLWETILSGEVWDGRLVNKRKNGTIYTEEQTVTPVKNADGKINHFIAIKRDISDRQAMEARLERSRNKEIQIAKAIQENLLSSQTPRNLTAFDIHATSIPSLVVDGDFYEFLPHGDRIFDLFIGDVMGKGLQAALLGAAAKTHFMKIFTKLVTRSGTPELPMPQQLITSLHAALVRQLYSLESFITMIYARFDGNANRLQLVDCGHTGIFHISSKKNTCTLINGSNCPMGFTIHSQYKEISREFSSGDIFVLFSDGVTEAQNAKKDLFGTNRLRKVIRASEHKTAKEIHEDILKSVSDWSDSKFSDDLTLITIKVRDPLPDNCIKTSEFRINSELEKLKHLREWVAGALRDLSSHKIEDELIEMILIAVNEAASNIIIHAYERQQSHVLDIKVEEFAKHLQISLTHDGLAFIPGRVVLPGIKDSGDGGFGLFIINKVFDLIDYTIDSEGRNVVQLTKEFREKMEE